MADMVGNIEFLGREGQFLQWEVEIQLNTGEGSWNSSPEYGKYAFEENLESDNIDWIGEDPIGSSEHLVQEFRDSLDDNDYYMKKKSDEIVKYMKERPTIEIYSSMTSRALA